MRVSNAGLTIILGVVLLAGSAAFAPSIAGDSRRDGDEPRWLSIRDVADKLEAAGYRHIEKIEREGGSYEARATDREGRRARLYVNPQTGEISEGRHEPRRRVVGDGTRYSADCNARRCRDDLAPKSDAAAKRPEGVTP